MPKSPLPIINRWTIAIKKQIIQSILSGDITEAEARAAYNISREELKTWIRLDNSFGPKGLRVTRLQTYRNKLRRAA